MGTLVGVVVGWPVLSLVDDDITTGVVPSTAASTQAE